MWAVHGYYNVVRLKRGLVVGEVHIGEVNWDGDPYRPLCRKSRARLFVPISGHVAKSRFCGECLRRMKADWPEESTS